MYIPKITVIQTAYSFSTNLDVYLILNFFIYLFRLYLSHGLIVLTLNTALESAWKNWEYGSPLRNKVQRKGTLMCVTYWPSASNDVDE